MDIDELLEAIGADPDEWEAEGGFGADDNLVHVPCGTMIEQDARQCPVCKVLNPITAAGLI